MRFRKKPVVIDAFQLTEDVYRDPAKWPKWTSENFADPLPRQPHMHEGVVYVRTMEGNMRADVNDWIIKGVKGELYPCKPDIFQQTYDPVEEE